MGRIAPSGIQAARTTRSMIEGYNTSAIIAGVILSAIHGLVRDRM